MSDNELLLEISKMLNPIRGDILEMRQDLDDIKNRVKRIELTQENRILPGLNTIEACYTSTFDRYKCSVEDCEAMKQDIDIMKKVITEHSEKLNQIA